MCDQAIVDGKLIESVADLESALGISAIRQPYYQVTPTGNQCLCGVDLQAMAKAVGKVCRMNDMGRYIFEESMNDKPNDDLTEDLTSSRCRREDLNWTVEAINRWEDYLIASQNENVTENGKYPHRISSTGHAMTLDGIRKLCGLARFAVKVGRKNGKQSDKMLIEFLRMQADRLEGMNHE